MNPTNPRLTGIELYSLFDGLEDYLDQILDSQRSMSLNSIKTLASALNIPHVIKNMFYGTCKGGKLKGTPYIDTKKIDANSWVLLISTIDLGEGVISGLRYKNKVPPHLQELAMFNGRKWREYFPKGKDMQHLAFKV